MNRIKYITNKDLLAEIHRAKLSYCSFERPEYSRFDVIVHSVDQITPELLDKTVEIKTALLAKKGALAWEGAVEGEPVTKDKLVVRVMSDKHVPQDDGTSRRRRVPGSSTAIRTVFPPFSHYVVRDGVPVEVGRSHWVGSISNGHFSGDCGRISNRLAEMFVLLVDRYARRGNFRGYTYVDEMRGHALLQLSQVGLQFDESKSDNPFAFYTQVVKNCFTRILNVERRNQHIRDDLLIIAGATPSYTRQIDHEIEQRFAESDDHKSHEGAAATEAPAPKKRGRKPKVAA